MYVHGVNQQSSNSLIYTPHKSTSEFMERNKKCRYVSSTILNAQAPDKYQHVAKRLLIVGANIVETSTCLETNTV